MLRYEYIRNLIPNFEYKNQKGGIVLNCPTLKEYVARVYELESSLYNLQQIHTQLENQIYHLNNVGEQSLRPKEKEPEFNDIGSMFCFAVIGAIIALGFWWFVGETFDLPVNNVTASLLLGSIIVMAIIGFLLPVIWHRNELAATRIRNQQIAQQNNQIQAKNAQNRALAKKKAAILQQELSVIHSACIQTENVVDAYYKKNVIAPKYQCDLVAISSFHEYLQNGRTHSLVLNGSDQGAYNIFENEIRLNVIIRKLDDIIDQLDQIKDNQYMLYCAIQESNQKTDQILRAVGRTADKLDSIQHNTAATSFHSAIAANNTEYLKWVQMLK